MAQGVIDRLADNCARMKTWTVTLAAAVLVFAGAAPDPGWPVAAGGCVPVIAFWAMDARYLRLERCYRKLYEAVAAGGEVAPFDLDWCPHAAGVASVWSVALSWSVAAFYAPLLAAMAALLAVLAA